LPDINYLAIMDMCYQAFWIQDIQDELSFILMELEGDLSSMFPTGKSIEYIFVICFQLGNPVNEYVFN